MKINTCKYSSAHRCFYLFSRLFVLLGLTFVVPSSYAWMSKDRTTEIHGFLDHTAHLRLGERSGLSKSRNRLQLELQKRFKPGGAFAELSLNGTIRASYDGVYDLNDGRWGDQAGGTVLIENQGGSAIGMPSSVPYGAGVILPGGLDLSAGNTNSGLRVLGSESFLSSGGLPGFGGVQLAYPVQPCDIDPRGCIPGYLNFDEDDLQFPEINSRQDWLRELYVDASIRVADDDLLTFRIGRQQVVWGRTDLFRVLDVVNPVDFSIQNIYEELEDSRIPQGIFNMEYRMGGTNIFEDLNFQFIWTFEKFRPNKLGQGGTPYSILDAGNLFRALSMCYHSGCTVANFAPNMPPGTAPTGLLATNFPARTIGIRQAFVPDKNDQFGVKVEGVFHGVGFSANALSFYSQLPSLRGGSAGAPTINPFVAPGMLDPLGAEIGGDLLVRPYLIAFDIHFPKIFLLGGSTDFYIDKVKTAFRVEVAHTNGEEFANTLDPRLYSKSRVVRWVVGADHNAFIPFLNKNRAFLFSGQLFGQHLLDHQEIETPTGRAGMPDWRDNFISTLLIKGWYKNDRLSPQIITAYDFGAKAAVVSPSLDWLINDNWRLTLAANIKLGRAKNEFDDCRTCNPFPPFTGAPNAVGQSLSRLGGMTPIGIFRSGPIGMAQDEDELQLLLRYRF